jgi:hypothetical protein
MGKIYLGDKRGETETQCPGRNRRLPSTSKNKKDTIGEDE